MYGYPLIAVNPMGRQPQGIIPCDRSLYLVGTAVVNAAVYYSESSCYPVLIQFSVFSSFLQSSHTRASSNTASELLF